MNTDPSISETLSPMDQNAQATAGTNVEDTPTPTTTEDDDVSDSAPKGSLPGAVATYSPDDNKLRLYTSSRLSAEDYARVRGAGFKWAPKQELFVAPAWSPDREDLLIELAGEIVDEDRSLIDRAEDRAERFEGYSERRFSDAQRAHDAAKAIADGIPLGQPILVGHHSERHARRDAKRIENGFRKAVQMWDRAERWQRRARSAICHAHYKLRPDVRARRIATLEAERRKITRNLKTCSASRSLWASIHDDAASGIKRRDGSVSTMRSRLDFAVGSTNAAGYELYTAYTNGDFSAEQVQAAVLANVDRIEAIKIRWATHLDNRLAYERAMVVGDLGCAPEEREYAVGGTVTIDTRVYTVIRVNKSAGRTVSVTLDRATRRHYDRILPINEIRDYAPPDLDAPVATPKAPPLCNYPGDGFAHITQAQWDAVSSEYKATRNPRCLIAATETDPAHYVRRALGCFIISNETNDNRRHGYHHVYITDAKLTTPRAAAVSEQVRAKLPPIVNTADNAWSMTSAEWAKISADFKSVVLVDATPERGAYRYRSALRNSTLWPVFLSDKEVVPIPKG